MMSLIIPAMNEQWRLPPTLAEIIEFQRKNPGFLSEIIVVDDGSDDSTVERAMYYQRKLDNMKIERLPTNQGKWAAIRHGLYTASNDWVLLMDADGSAQIWELEKVDDLKGHMEEGRAIFGSRFMEDSEVHGKSFLRNIISRVYRIYVLFMYWIVTGESDIDDMQAPFKIFRISDIEDELQVDRFAGDIELAINLDAEIVNHPLEFYHKGGSTLPWNTSWKMFLETLEVVKRELG